MVPDFLAASLGHQQASAIGNKHWELSYAASPAHRYGAAIPSICLIKDIWGQACREQLWESNAAKDFYEVPESWDLMAAMSSFSMLQRLGRLPSSRGDTHKYSNSVAQSNATLLQAHLTI